MGEGEYRGEFSQDLGGGERKGSVAMLWEPGGSSAADARVPCHPPTHIPDPIPLLSPASPAPLPLSPDLPLGQSNHLVERATLVCPCSGP